MNSLVTITGTILPSSYYSFDEEGKAKAVMSQMLVDGIEHRVTLFTPDNLFREKLFSGGKRRRAELQGEWADDKKWNFRVTAVVTCEDIPAER